MHYGMPIVQYSVVIMLFICSSLAAILMDGFKLILSCCC